MSDDAPGPQVRAAEIIKLRFAQKPNDFYRVPCHAAVWRGHTEGTPRDTPNVTIGIGEGRVEANAHAKPAHRDGSREGRRVIRTDGGGHRAP